MADVLSRWIWNVAAASAESPVGGQFEAVGDIGEAGLDPVAPFGDDFQQQGRPGGALAVRGRDEQRDAAGWEAGGELPAAEPLVREEVTRGRAFLQHADGDLALADGGGHDAPDAHDPAAQVGVHG